MQEMGFHQTRFIVFFSKHFSRYPFEMLTLNSILRITKTYTQWVAITRINSNTSDTSEYSVAVLCCMYILSLQNRMLLLVMLTLMMMDDISLCRRQ